MIIHFQQLLIITKYEASLLVTTITKRYKSFYERKSMMVEIITHRSSVQNLTHKKECTMTSIITGSYYVEGASCNPNNSIIRMMSQMLK